MTQYLLSNVTPTGRTIALEMIAVVTFDNDGHVVGERVFIDSAGVAGQLVD